MEKEYKTFTQLSAYKEVFPIVIKTVQILDSYKRKNTEFTELIEKAENHAISILTSLADGYNKYHAEDKAALYNQARSNLTHTQSLIQILGGLGAIPNEVSTKIVKMFDEKIKIFNGIIRKMEDKC